MLEVADLVSGYGRARILRGLSFRIGAGELVMLLGRNGAGKSTTLRTVMGLLRAEGGSIRLAGQEIAGWEPHRIARAGLGYVPEDRHRHGFEQGRGWRRGQARGRGRRGLFLHRRNPHDRNHP